MPMLSRPKGVTIYRRKDRRYGGHVYDCAIKSKGRTGARTRMALQNLSFGERQYFLSEWWHGRAAVI